MLDFILLIAVRTFVFFLNCCPLAIRLKLVELLIRFSVVLMPRFERIARANLDIAFPEKDQSWKDDVIKKSYPSLARLFVDFARLKQLDLKWADQHVDGVDFVDALVRRKTELRKSFVLVTGHLGSFELLGQIPGIKGNPISFVARDFKFQRLNAWWNSIRERNDNRVISRKGAFKEVLRELASGRDVAILFDQNITRQHAVFVDWFGKKAATTKMVALSALRTEASIMVVSMSYLGQEKYKANSEECDFQELYADKNLSLEQKVEILTQKVSSIYERMIREAPHEWFWMHRRWKTRPEGGDSLY